MLISHIGRLTQLDTRLRGYDEQENYPGQQCAFAGMTRKNSSQTALRLRWYDEQENYHRQQCAFAGMTSKKIITDSSALSLV